MRWLPEPLTLNLMAHCSKSIYHSVDSRQLRLVIGTSTCGGVPSRQKKMSKREMKWPPNSRWTWLNQQWKSMSWKELAGKINERIMYWPMNFVPFCISTGCHKLNIPVYLFQIILAFLFLFTFLVASSSHATIHQALCTI